MPSKKQGILPQEGSKAPYFPELNNYNSKYIVLYFYPKDDTPGCTVQACGFRDSFKEITKLNAAILGISPDSAKSHDKFINKFQLPFPLIPDEDKKICESYGVWVEKSMYGRKYMGVARTTFIIDKDGTIAKVFEKVKPEGHHLEIINFLSSK
jgi:peroxiredoxin Q/BCP